MALLTSPADLRALRDLIADHHRALSVVVLGADAVGADPAEIQRLVQAGILDPAAVASVDPIRDQYLLGFARRRIEDTGKDPMALSLDDFHAMIRRDPMPLTVAEHAAIDSARVWAGEYLANVGNRVAGQIVGTVGDYGAGYRAQVGETVAEGMAERATWREIQGDLQDAIGDWTRDWGRVAATEVQKAQNDGYAADLDKTFGKDARVAMIPNPSACKSCRRLYLENGRPKVFLLSELRANGSNRGRKQADWLPTLDPAHPWCACTPAFLPDGMGFDEKWHLVELVA